MALLTGLIPTAQDAEGRTYPDALLYSYEINTNTPKATYFDDAFITPNANPVVADGAGRFFNVFFDGAYKLKLVDKYGEEIWTQNDYNTGTGNSSQIADAFYANHAGSAANAYIVDAPASLGVTSYLDGMLITWRPSHHNTGASTINVLDSGGSPMGAKPYILPDKLSALTDRYLETTRDYKARYVTSLDKFVDCDMGWWSYNSGIPVWSALVQYVTVPSFVTGTDEQLYKSTARSGTSHGGAVDPVGDVSGTWILQGTSVNKGYISGLITANNAITPSGKIDFGTGSCRSRNNQANMVNSSVMTKDATAAWASGDGNGGMGDSLSLVAGWFRMFIISKTDGTVDFGFDTSATANNLLTSAVGFTYYRQIGWFVYETPANSIRAYFQEGNDFVWDVPKASNMVPAANSLLSPGAPPDNNCKVNIYCFVNSETAATGYVSFYPTRSSARTASAANFHAVAGSDTTRSAGSGNASIYLDANSIVTGGRIGVSCSVAEISSLLYTVNQGWTDPRGQG